MASVQWETDPVRAYSRIAPEFARLSDERQSYLAGIEREIIAAIPKRSATLLDVGAADGVRAMRIAVASGIQQVTLAEPAEGMPTEVPGARVVRLRAEELQNLPPGFDVITCLWNVLGHVFPAPARIAALKEFDRLLNPGGRIFIDVSNRYNVSHYGALPTLGRFLGDRLTSSTENGDTNVQWQTSSGPVGTRGHVFRPGEFRGLVMLAGLEILDRRAMDYATGERRRWVVQGHLLYALRRSSPRPDGSGL